jgi:hypothetical protein
VASGVGNAPHRRAATWICSPFPSPPPIQ